MAGLTKTSARAPHIPAKGTKQYQLLSRLLAGDQVDPFTALMEMNLPTVNARASELRRMGWPVMSKKSPHPKLKSEWVVVFYFDQHFRRWVVDHPHLPPVEYTGQEGRGKFAA
jgi:hypothetical protein